MSSSYYSDPLRPPPQKEGGNWVWDAAKGFFTFVKDNVGDILQTGAGLVEGYMSSQDRQKQLEELARQYSESLKQRQSEAATSSEQFGKTLAEQQANRQQSGTQFERTTGDTEAQAAVRAQTQLNAAPMADKAQALLLARMGVAPGQFQGRDYTKGTDDLTRTVVAPSANVTSAMQSAANGYQSGDGGVDTSTMRMLLDKMKASGFKDAAPPVAPPEKPPEGLPPGARLRPPIGTVPPEFIPPASRPRIPILPPNTLPMTTPSIPRPPAPREEEPEDTTSPGGILRRRMGIPT